MRASQTELHDVSKKLKKDYYNFQKREPDNASLTPTHYRCCIAEAMRMFYKTIVVFIYVVCSMALSQPLTPEVPSSRQVTGSQGKNERCVEKLSFC